MTPPLTNDETLDALNMTVRDIMRTRKDVYGGVSNLIPPDILDRVSRQPPWSCGFTGFKGSLPYQDDAPAGQFLVAVAPSFDVAISSGKREGDWRFYYATVPGPGAGSYNIGDTFDIPPAEVRRRVVGMSIDELAVILRDGIERVCAAVIEGEKDRRVVVDDDDEKENG